LLFVVQVIMTSNRFLRGLLFIGGTVLMVSLAANIFLFQRARQYYLDMNAVHLDPLGLNTYSGVPSASTGVRVVFFGDSRATRWPLPGNQTDWEFINRGVEAQTAAQAVLRFQAHVRPLQPDMVVVQAGVNDLKTIPLFPERKTAIIASVKENIRDIVQQAKNLGAHVIVTTIFPIGEFPLERRLFWSPDIDIAVQDVNEYLRSLVSSDVSVLDTAAILSKDGRANTEYYDDELHLNQAGYVVLNRELTSLLTSLSNTTEKLP
jgi:lysophospholipase L1-like esterase